MRYKVISCSVFAREVSLLAARSDAVLDITWIRQGLHSYPSLLREELQREIDRTETPLQTPDRVARAPEEYSAIILGFGICSRAVAGLRTRRLPLVIPRSHDCIALLLGSNRRYRAEFDANPGTYWFSPGWIEQSAFPSGAQCALIQERFTEVYGEDNGEYLMQLERDSLAHYSRAAYIRWPELDRERYRKRTAEIAADFGWEEVTVEGDDGFLRRLLEGAWDEQEFLLCPPGHTLEIGDEESIIIARPADGATGG
ncbi:DUF1638 domain-containing protein [Salinispira pacifica]